MKTTPVVDLSPTAALASQSTTCAGTSAPLRFCRSLSIRRWALEHSPVLRMEMS